MPNLLDIGTSALMAYRTALTTTGENIANAATDGYSRRDTVVKEIAGGQMTVTSQNSGGQGVIVDQVRRAFDGFLAERVRTTAGEYTSAETFQTISSAIEDLFLPSVGGIATGLDRFFSGLSTLSGNPADTALRQAAMESANSLATSIADVAVGLQSLRADVVTQANTANDLLNEKMSALAELQDGMTGASNDNGGLNPLMDERDRLLRDISEIVGNKVKLDEFGRAKVYLGDNEGGPILVDIGEAVRSELDTDEDLRMVLTRDGVSKESTQITGGLIEGYRAAMAAIDEAAVQLDAFARRIATDVNTLHSTGLDKNGDFGGELFSMDGWNVKPDLVNQGSAFVEFTVTDDELADDLQTFTLTRDDAAGEWIAKDQAGTEIGRGATVLTLSGVTLTLTGTFADGDRLTISPRTGKAIDMKMALNDPAEFAASAANLVAPLASNSGTADAVMALVPASEPAVPDLSTILPVSGSGADAANLLSSGVVGYVPASASSLSLAAMGQQSTQDFVVSDAQAASATALTFSISGTSYSFDLSAVGAADASELAAALNAGTVQTIAGETLSDLGVHAAGTSGSLSLALGVGDFDAAATLSSGAGASAGALIPAQSGGGQIQIFTRNGVQLAGPALDATAAAALLTEDNGFFDGATYIRDYLYGNDADGYRGLSRSEQIIPGAETVNLTLAAPITWTSPAQRPLSDAQTLSIGYILGEDQEINLPQGASAARAAAMIAPNITGMSVDADTSAGLTISADGNVSFVIEGTNVEPLSINGLVSGGRMDSIAAAINARTAATGITASLAQDGSRIVLNHPDGENIAISAFSHSAGGTMDISPAGAYGLPSGTATTIGAGVDSISVTGTLTFNAPSAFGLGYDSVMYSSAIDTNGGGLVSQSYGQAGAVQTFAFSPMDDFDAGAASVDGLTAQAPSTQYTLNIAGQTVTYAGADPAAGLAASLRSQAPQAAMTGAALASLPPAGAATSVKLGEDTYVLRMTTSGITVTGPEQDRLTASFDASNRLTISVNDGTLDGAALYVPLGTSGAGDFGIAQSQSPASTLTGQTMDPAGLPSSMDIDVNGTIYTVPVSTGGAAVPTGFPGSAALVGGQIEFTFDPGTGPVSIEPSAGATAAGFGVLGMTMQVSGDDLTFTSSTGASIDADITVTSAASQRITLDNLPEEDLIIVMKGATPMRLGGGYEAGELSGYSPSVRVDVADAAAGVVRLVDNDTGHTIAERTLDDSNAAEFGTVQFALSGSAQDGDGFVMMANDGFINDSRNINAMAALRNADPTSGEGGFGRILAALQAQKGAMVSAAKARVEVTDANRESAERVYADRTAVDLDEEAARLIDQQQAYQASARILTVANELFDTLLNSL